MTTTKPSTINHNGWTEERRKAQSQAIQRWKPWLKSTGAKTAKGKAKVAQNAYKGGLGAEMRLLRIYNNALFREHKAMLERIKQKV